MNDLVSIITPSYNTAKYIDKTIKSVLNQTYSNWEMIIVDDCSTDITDQVIKPYLKDKRIRYIKNDTNLGAALSRNLALRESKGRWIAFLDSDDLWVPNKLEKQIRFMESNNYHFSYTNYEEVDDLGNSKNKMITGPKCITKKKMFDYCWPGCLTVMYDSNVVGLVQIKDIKKNNDYAMWLKICEKVDCYLLDECLSKYRRGRKGSISTHNIIIMIDWHYKLFRDVCECGVVKSIFHTLNNIIFGICKKLYYVKNIRINLKGKNES